MADSIDDLLARFKPSEKSVMRFLRGQQSQFNPLINTLLNQYRLSKGPSKTTKMYEELLKGLPSQEKISGSYDTAVGNLAKYMQNLNTTSAASGVSSAISAIGGAIGAAPGVTADVAGAAGTLSGVGATGGNVMSNAILGGAAARMYGTATQQMQSAAERAMQTQLGLAESQDADTAARRALGLQLAQTRSQRAGAAPSMLELYSTLLGIRGQEKALNGYGGRGGSSSDDEEEDGLLTGGLTPKQLKALQGSAANKYLQGISAGYFG